MNLQLFLQWFREHREVLWWTTAASVVLYALLLLALPVIAARVPRDYFKPGYRSPFRHDHPFLGSLVWMARNTAGGVMMLVGAVMIPLPGPGLPVVLMGLLLTTLPARRTLLRMALRRRVVLESFNWLRKRQGAEPFTLADLSRRQGRKLFRRHGAPATSESSVCETTAAKDPGPCTPAPPP